MRAIFVVLILATAVAKVSAGAGPPNTPRTGQPPNGYNSGGAQYGQVNIAAGSVGNNQTAGQGQYGRSGGATYAGVSIAPRRNGGNAGNAGNRGNTGSGPISVQTPRFP